MNDRAGILFAGLGKLAAFREGAGSLDDNLRSLSELAAEVLCAENCSIMLMEGQNLRVCANYGHLSADAYKALVRKGEGISGHVAATGQSLLLKDIAQSEFAQLGRYPEAPKSMISAPLAVNGEVIGVININSPMFGQPFDRVDLDALEIAAAFISRTIEAKQLKGVLDSRFAMMALIRQQGDAAALIGEIQNPERMARLLAKSFYREMMRAGFGAAQIVNAATEIISELSGTLHRHKERLERN